MVSTTSANRASACCLHMRHERDGIDSYQPPRKWTEHGVCNGRYADTCAEYAQSHPEEVAALRAAGDTAPMDQGTMGEQADDDADKAADDVADDVADEMADEMAGEGAQEASEFAGTAADEAVDAAVAAEAAESAAELPAEA